MSKEELPTIKVNWKLAIYAIAGVVIAIGILIFVKLSPYFKVLSNPIS